MNREERYALKRARFDLEGTPEYAGRDPKNLVFALPIQPLKDVLAFAKEKGWPAEHERAAREFASRVREARNGRPDPFWIVQVEYEKDGELVFLLRMDDFTKLAQGGRVLTQAEVEHAARESVEGKGGKLIDLVTLLVADV